VWSFCDYLGGTFSDPFFSLKAVADANFVRRLQFEKAHFLFAQQPRELQREPSAPTTSLAHFDIPNEVILMSFLLHNSVGRKSVIASTSI
jgi:hypothetical protein